MLHYIHTKRTSVNRWLRSPISQNPAIPLDKGNEGSRNETGCILVPIALFSSLSRRGLGTRIEGLWGHQPRPQGLLLDDFQNGGSSAEDPGEGWVTWYKISKKTWRFLSRDVLREAKTKWRRSIAWEATYRSKNALTLYTRQWCLRSKIKYYFNGCFDSGAGLFSICKFIPLSYSLYFE